MRRWHLCCDEELEVFVVVDRLFTELHEELRALLLDLLGEDRLQHGIEGLSRVFIDHGVAVLDRDFETAGHDVTSHRGLQDGKIGVVLLLLLVLVLEPLVSLHLRVNHQGPPL